jgi:hypothetical protein
MSREYVIPVMDYNMIAGSIEDDGQLPYSNIKTVTRKHYIIEKQINHINKKISEVYQNNLKPTTLVLNQTDYEFINAYFRYNPNFFIAFQANQVKGAYSLFGLKVIISNIKHPMICWEP